MKFTSSSAAKTFYEAHIVPDRRTERKQHTVSVNLPIQLPYRSYELGNGTTSLNRSVRAADLNRDGMISLKEARTFEAKRVKQDNETR